MATQSSFPTSVLKIRQTLLKSIASLFKSGRFYAFLFLTFLGLWGVIKACSTNGLRDHVYHIARDGSFQPIPLLGKGKNMVAFTDELLIEIAKAEDFQFRIVNGGYSNLLPGLQSGLYDAIISNLAPTPGNRERYSFSDSFYLLGPVLIVRSSFPFTSLSDMDGKIVGLKRGDSLTLNLVENPGWLLTPYDNISMALDSLVNNVIDGVILDALPAYDYIHGFYGGLLKVVTPPLTDEGIRLIAHKEDTDGLIFYFNKGLKTLKENGGYEQLLQKWDLMDTEAAGRPLKK